MAFFLPRTAFNPARQHGAARHEFAPLWSLLDDTINEVARSSRNSLESFNPRFDMRETKDAYALEGELPGIEQKDVSIQFTDDHTLTVKGRTERHHESGTPPSSAGALEGTSTKGAIEDKDHSHQPSVEDEEDPAQQKQHSTEIATTSGEDKPVANKTEESSAPAPQHQYWISERSVGSFERSFNFPARVDQDAVKASLKNGVLSIVVPKAKATQGRRINIE